ncbi:YggS family pyridoxal phosphate-dependent enzyme [Sporosarcina sp. ANT_H38]|uniref:YggS family pyridoxal phosphate-dependent enzyme n=1 Tax=Sporosarcina sp. ANT_H38 TaxID=2597358 RepID=UPI0011F15CFC|nr:YggS family pyridoxal phosphate-dependent enzyme [Sporosarcina sp. ANT_H38]KAA0966591.1 YggS family pyridoxal phosphate-dependent enzyme [Sporosarcina sp. ANT_H38]
MGNLQQRIQNIEHDIQATCDRTGRNRAEITVVAVTKEVSTARTSAVLDANIQHLGENRPEGLLGKQLTIQSGAIWHFIGNVQSRKVKEIINQIDYLHSVDRMSLVKEIHKRADHVVDCFIQVNVSGEASKSGVTPAELDSFIKEVATYDKVRIIGLMTMAPFTKDVDEIRSVFRSLRELRDGISVKNLLYAPCTQLSMGMSNDFIIAIEEGATHVRIGTALVGAESEGDV